MRTRSFWEQANAEVEAGESIPSVARRRGVKPGTLSWWRWKIRSEKRSHPHFLPVVVANAATSACPVEIVVGSITVRVIVGTDVEYVSSLAAALRRQC